LNLNCGINEVQDKMRIYSNTLISWPHGLHLFQAARMYPGRWHNYYLYRVRQTNPLEFITYSPINLLQENRQYYCYDRFYRDLRPEKLGNSLELVSVHNKTVSFGEELWVHIPKYIKVNDIIAINHTFPTGVPSICLH